MCGISGEYRTEGTPNREAVTEMGRAIAHRGPDETIQTNYQQLSVAFNWLSIRDRSRKPPARYGAYTVWLNGEIYNHRELRKELGWDSLPGDLDTETIAIGIAIYGIGYISKLNGMFAIVAYNDATGELIIARDRFGVKPIYYAEVPGGVLFSSELKAFKKHPAYKFKVNRNAVGQWLTYQNNFDYTTLFDGVRLLEPGHILIYRREGVIKDVYHRHSINETRNVSQDEIRTTVEAAIDRQVPAEKYAVWLSGGIDSGIIASRTTPDYYLTAGWKESIYDERKEAELVEKKGGGVHIEIVTSRETMFKNLRETIETLDDLRVGPSWSNYVLNGIISKHCRITLQGTGGDELFAGYTWRYEGDYADVIDRTKLPEGFIRYEYNRLDGLQTDLDYRDRQLFDLEYFLQGVLIVGDRISARYGIEERVPFLDNELAAIALQVPDSHKYGKKILREAFGMEPRKKRGFTSPEKDWYFKDDLVLKMLTDKDSRLNDYVAAKHIPELFAQENTAAIWSLLALNEWLKIYDR